MQDSILYIKIHKSNVTDITRIFEGYEYLALVSTVSIGTSGDDTDMAIVKLRGTPDTIPDVRAVVQHLPFPCIILEGYTEES